MNKDIEMEQQIVDKITALIKPENLHLAKILLQENKGNDSIIIKLENNPWRNGFIKGDIILARIKTNGDNPYLNFKNKFLYLFDGMDIKYLPVSDLETEYDWARVELNSFVKLLDNPTEDFIKAINAIYFGNAIFPEFGCCSKHMECTKAGRCLHIDPLYATACQYQKLMKRKGVFENF